MTQAVIVDSSGTQTSSGRAWVDGRGFVGSVEPGTGPRRDPVGYSPSGPEVGQVLPEVVARDHNGHRVEVMANGSPVALVCFRSAVW